MSTGFHCLPLYSRASRSYFAPSARCHSNAQFCPEIPDIDSQFPPPNVEAAKGQDGISKEDEEDEKDPAPTPIYKRSGCQIVQHRQITAARPVDCPTYERWRQNSSAHHLLPALAASYRQSSAYLLMAPVSEA